MPRLKDLASVIRSKNAGPLTLSFDLMFPDRTSYDIALNSAGLTPENLGVLFDTPSKNVLVTPYPAAWAIKVALPRKMVSGTPGDRDVYGAQQHAPLLELVL